MTFGVVILPFAAGERAVTDGLRGAVVVTGQATRTVVEPDGVALAVGNDVVRGAMAATRAAGRTPVATDAEPPVRRNEVAEQPAQRAGLQSRPGARHDAADTHPPRHDIGGDKGQLTFGSVQLFCGKGRRIDVEARQADVRIGHTHRVDAVDSQPLSRQATPQQAVGPSDVVATSQDGVYIIRCLRTAHRRHTVDEPLHHARQAPRMDREHPPQTRSGLATGHHVAAGVGHVYEAVARSPAEGRRHVAAVARSAEVENRIHLSVC